MLFEFAVEVTDNKVPTESAIVKNKIFFIKVHLCFLPSYGHSAGLRFIYQMHHDAVGITGYRYIMGRGILLPCLGGFFPFGRRHKYDECRLFN
jgi:hypothetical protein